MTEFGKRDPGLFCAALEECVWDLNENSSAVTHGRVGSDRTAMVEFGKNLEAHTHELVTLLAVHVRDEPDAAGIVLIDRIV
jgi:hypothetical protein